MGRTNCRSLDGALSFQRERYFPSGRWLGGEQIALIQSGNTPIGVEVSVFLAWTILGL